MHTGNIRFRALIQKYKPIYHETPKKLKPTVSTRVVAIWRAQKPPGRFLTRSDCYHGSNRRTYYDVGDAAARRKAAQCLREKSARERASAAIMAEKKNATEAAIFSECQEESTEDDEELDAVLCRAQEESHFDTAPVQTLNVDDPEAINFLHEVASSDETAASSNLELSETTFPPAEFVYTERMSLVCQMLSDEEQNSRFPIFFKRMEQQAKKKYGEKPEKEPFSLSGVLSAHHITEEGSYIDESFSMGGITFGDDDSETSDGQGLGFPSLTESAVSSAFPSLGGAGLDVSSSLGNTNTKVYTAGCSEKSSDTLSDIRNAVPTAASLLTANLFDD